MLSALVTRPVSVGPQMGSRAVANQTAYVNGRTAGCAACSDTPPQPAVYTCAQQVPGRTPL